MDNIGNIAKVIRRNIKEHSPVILSTFAGVGTLTTAYLASRASFKAARLIDEWENENMPAMDPKERLMERTKLVWKLYIPAGTSAVSTIACIVGANRVGANKAIAAQTALSVSQQLYSDYRDKIIEEYGEGKDQSIRDKLAEGRLKDNPPPSNDVLVTGPGNSLCCELYTGRYFACDMETLRKAMNTLNAKILSHDYATLWDFYYMIGLGHTKMADHVGWRSPKLMDLQFSVLLTDDGRPCLTFDYNYTTTL